MEEKKQKPKSPTPEIVRKCIRIELHSAVILAGKTETNIHKKKIKEISTMGWTHDNQVLIELASGEVHEIPSAAVKDSVWE